MYHVSDNKVYCITQYAGKSVRGIAKCHPEDTFELDDGKDLAKARCDVKLWTKKLSRANKRVLHAFEELRIAEEHVRLATQYQDEAIASLSEAKSVVEELEEKFSVD